MNTDRLRMKIERAIRKESDNHEVKATLVGLAAENGEEPNDEAVQEIVTWLEGYVRSVPGYLEEALTHADAAGLSNQMGFLVEKIGEYWDLKDDLIPDKLGLMGLLDDAFASTFLLETLCDYSRSNGRTLLDEAEAEALAQVNDSVRRIIGPTVYERLEARVLDTFNQASTQRWLNDVVAGSVSFNTPRPVWGRGNKWQAADIHLGALGIDTAAPWRTKR